MALLVSTVVIALSMTLGAAGASKILYLAHPNGFLTAKYPALSAAGMRLLGGVELLLALWLLTGFMNQLSYVATALLFSSFIGYRLLFRKAIVAHGCRCMIAVRSADWGASTLALLSFVVLSVCPLLANAVAIYSVDSVTRIAAVVLALMMARACQMERRSRVHASHARAFTHPVVLANAQA